MPRGQWKNVELQKRDYELLAGLFECRVMTLAHIAQLHFSGRKEAAKKRVRKLKIAGYIQERPRATGTISVHFLGRKSLAALRTEGYLARFPTITDRAAMRRAQVSALSLSHELDVVDVRVRIISAIHERADLSLAAFSSWPLLHQFRTNLSTQQGGPKTAHVKPDGLFRVRAMTASRTLQHTFFVEVDRGTETLAVLVGKALCYSAFYRSGGMAERFGANKDRYKDYPFRVLFITRSSARRDNLARSLAQNNPPLLSQVWISTYAELAASPLGAIWVRPRDYVGSKDGEAGGTRNSRLKLL